MQPAVRREWEQLLTAAMPEECPGEFNEAVMELGETVCLPVGHPLCEACPVRRFCQADAHGVQEQLPVRAPKKKRRIEERTVLLLLYEACKKTSEEESSGERLSEEKPSGERLSAESFLGERPGAYRVGIRRRPKEGLLSGLYEFPSEAGHLSAEEAAAFCEKRRLPVCSIRETRKARHIFTHVEWDMTGYLIFLDGDVMDSRPADSGSPILYVGLDDLRDTYALPTAFQAYREVLEQIPSSHNV